MSITSRKVFDPSTKTLMGDVTFPGEQGIATHALTFMLVGIRPRWTHVVGYHFTGNSVSSDTLEEIAFQIIKRAEFIRFHVDFITSDMGSENLGLWRKLNIRAIPGDYYISLLTFRICLKI